MNDKSFIPVPQQCEKSTFANAWEAPPILPPLPPTVTPQFLPQTSMTKHTFPGLGSKPLSFIKTKQNKTNPL